MWSVRSVESLFAALTFPCVRVMVLYCLHTLVVCGSRLKRGLTFTSAFLAAGGHTHTPTIPWAHPHIHIQALAHSNTLTNPHVRSHTHLLADGTIETAPSVDFLPLLNPDYFRVATPNLWAGGGRQELSPKLRQLAGVKKNPSSLWFSHLGI